jgi:hypothetical protein
MKDRSSFSIGGSDKNGVDIPLAVSRWREGGCESTRNQKNESNSAANVLHDEPSFSKGGIWNIAIMNPCLVRGTGLLGLAGDHLS